MEELNTPIFAQAKVEYTAQLVDMLYPHMFDGVKSIYDESKLLYGRKKTAILLIFRELLEKVPIWNSEIIDSECSRIVSNSSCDYIDDLITAVFISHTKILTSIGPNKSFQKINITIPKTSTFVHKCYINTARELWKNPYLFNENVPGHEFQKNNKEIECIIKKCIENTIRNSLPIKDILKEHLEGENDSILNQKETLKQMLREELSNFAPQNIQQTHIEQLGGDKDEEFILVDDEEEKDSPEIDNSSNVNEPKSDIPTLSSIINNDINNDNKVIDSGPTIVKEEDNISDLQSKINDIVTKEKDIQNELNNISEEQSMSEKFPASDDPTDAQVEKACNDIVVNDITIPVDIPGETPSTNTTIPPALDKSTSNPVVEIKYDNVDITNDKKEGVGEDKLKKFMTNMQAPNEEVSVVKSDVVATPIINPIPQPEPEPQPQSGFSFDSLYPNMNNSSTNNSITNNSITNNSSTSEPTKSVNDPIVKPLQIIEENKSVNNPTINIPQEPKSPRKEMVAVQNEDDIDETSSLANFFDDMKKIVEDKGIKVEQNNNKMFTLFEDANEVEK